MQKKRFSSWGRTLLELMIYIPRGGYSISSASYIHHATKRKRTHVQVR